MFKSLFFYIYYVLQILVKLFLLCMSEHNEHKEQDHQNHDDCDDCKRQRAENDKLIAIYQRLQDVDKKSSDMRSSFIIHKQNFQKTINKLKSFDQKVQKIKNNKSSQQQSQFQQIGYNLYSEILQNNKKNDLLKQNLRLKQVLKNMYLSSYPFRYQQRQKSTSKVQDKITQQTNKTPNPIIFPQINEMSPMQWFTNNNPREKSSRLQSRASQIYNNEMGSTQMAKSSQISSTKSSFNMTKRKAFQKKDFQQLNLWLFDNKNQVLEKQLYQKNRDDEQVKNPQKTKLNLYNQLSSGVQRYVNKFKNASSNEKRSIFRKSQVKKNGSFQMSERKKQSSLDRSQHGSTFNDNAKKSNHSFLKQGVTSDSQTNSSRFFNRRFKKQIMLPSILNK